MYVWTDTDPAKIINLNNCVSIEADEENNELYAIGNDGTCYFLHSFTPENIVDAIRSIYDHLKEDCQAIDMSDIVSELQPPPPVGRRRPPKRLIVTLEDNTRIEHVRQADTFIEAIERVGTDKVHALRLGTERHPLLKLRNTDDPPEQDRRVDTSGFYSINIVYSAKGKKRIVDKIADEFGLQWNVEVIDR
ncbi:hypothetical protein F4054_15645 [Candidatus Poribacteria bacterium]|nr:hypothetical protein [Candidatus Poribacteria bacterium]